MTEHALYRFFNSDGELLYIGITYNPGSRWPQHAADKPWWQQVARITIETLPDRDAVLNAERRAIQDEQPRYNVIHNRAVTQPSVTHAKVDPKQYLFTVGDVVAVGVDPNKTAPVGLVASVDSAGFTLDMYSWLTGYFGYGSKRIRWGQVKSFLRAQVMPREIADRRGYSRSNVIWDMDPLADFQRDWKGDGQ